MINVNVKIVISVTSLQAVSIVINVMKVSIVKVVIAVMKVLNVITVDIAHSV